MEVEVEMTWNAAAPVLDHCDQFDGILPTGVELKVSTNQGDADGAVRGSNCSRRGTKHEARFLFMTGSCFEQDGPTGPSFDLLSDESERRGAYTQQLAPGQGQVLDRLGETFCKFKFPPGHFFWRVTRRTYGLKTLYQSMLSQHEAAF